MLAILAVALLAAAGASATTINSATVSGNQLTVGGIGFNGALTVTLNGQTLKIVRSTSTQIVSARCSQKQCVRSPTLTTSYVAFSRSIGTSRLLTAQGRAIPGTSRRSSVGYRPIG